MHGERKTKQNKKQDFVFRTEIAVLVFFSTAVDSF